MRILVTGGCGFIGSHFIDLLRRERPADEIVNLDVVNYAAVDPSYMEDAPNYRFIPGSISNRYTAAYAMEDVNAVVNFAAETHVDRSLQRADQFVRSNLEGVVVLLDLLRETPQTRFLQVSTDEVYGSCEDGVPFTEQGLFSPGNPYAVTKAAADMMVKAYVRSFGLDCVVTRSANNYGPRQYPEKFMPVMIGKAMRDEALPVYGDGQQRRQWLWVEDNCRGILAALEKGRPGEIYNLPGVGDVPNLDVARMVAQYVGNAVRVEHVQDRPGHDRVYRIDGAKAARELDWSPRTPLSEGIRKTVEWYQANPAWIARMEEARLKWGKG